MSSNEIFLKVTHSGRQDCRNMHSWGPGCRDSYIIHHITRGKGYLEAGGITYTVNCGESFIIYPDTVVRYYPDSLDPWEYVWFNFTGQEADELLSGTGFSLNTPVSPVCDKLAPIFNSACDAYRRGGIGDELRVKGYVHLAFAYFTEIFPCTAQIPSALKQLERAKGFIEANLHRHDLTVENVACELNISRVTLYRLFSVHKDSTPCRYITEQRIKRACFMLLNSELSIKEISCSSGFEDPLYFSKVFKSVMKCTPTDYRLQKHR